MFTFVTFGWLSSCQTATSCLKDARSVAVSVSDAKPSSPQSNSFTIYVIKEKELAKHMKIKVVLLIIW